MKHKISKWDETFMDLAWWWAERSKDPSTGVGCVLVDGRRRVIGQGYNGFPQGVEDLPDRLEDREEKYLFTQHAEANAVLAATVSPFGATAYVTHHPCANCAGLLIQAGIARVVTNRPEVGLAHRFCDSFRVAKTMLAEAGVGLYFMQPEH